MFAGKADLELRGSLVTKGHTRYPQSTGLRKALPFYRCCKRNVAHLRPASDDVLILGRGTMPTPILEFSGPSREREKDN
jgi:hypothetical protein